MDASSSTQRQRHQAREHAEDLESDAVSYPQERGEILLEAAGQWSVAGEEERALEIYDDLIASASEEDAQWAIAGKIQVLDGLGRHEEVRTEMARLKESPAHPGPASVVAEFLESQDRLEEALTWFNIACRDVLGDEGEQIEPETTFTRTELDGRARVRKALGLPPDALDQFVGEKRAELVSMLDRFARRDDTSPTAKRPAGLGSFFVRADVKRAFAEGLVHVDDPEDDDVASYLRRVERGWRSSARETGITRLAILPTTVDDLLKYGEDHGRDPKDQQTRLDYLQDRVYEGALTISWPPERNQPCWCGSARKYKKCCGAAANR
jgi:SEC-C motif